MLKNLDEGKVFSRQNARSKVSFLTRLLVVEVLKI